MYPNYVYRPQRTKDKKNKKGKSRGEHDTDTESFSFLLPVSSSPSRSLSRDFVPSHGHGHGRRAASAPTPPPAFQAIQLPTVWMPSCPTSPSLIPRISGRSPAPAANIPPPTESAPLTTFDYAPNDEQLFMPSYQSHSTFDGSDLQVCNASRFAPRLSVSCPIRGLVSDLLLVMTCSVLPRGASFCRFSFVASRLVSLRQTRHRRRSMCADSVDTFSSTPTRSTRT